MDLSSRNLRDTVSKGQLIRCRDMQIKPHCKKLYSDIRFDDPSDCLDYAIESFRDCASLRLYAVSVKVLEALRYHLSK